MIPKQDRIKPRTVEDLERMYKFKAAAQNSRETQAMASSARQSAEQASKDVADKVGKNDYEEIVRMLNHATEKVVLLANRLIVQSDNFSITEDGDVSVKGKVTSEEVNITGGKFDLVLSNGTHVRFGVGVDAFCVDSSDYDAAQGTGKRVQLTPNAIHYNQDGVGARPIVFSIVTEENGSKTISNLINGRLMLNDATASEAQIDIGKKLMELEQRISALE